MNAVLRVMIAQGTAGGPDSEAAHPRRPLISEGAQPNIPNPVAGLPQDDCQPI